ncbi:MAG: hypothetical protein WAK55_22585 [Xanthobacteraceae bacterium]
MRTSKQNKQPKKTRADDKLFGALYRERDKAIERLIALWPGYGANGNVGDEVDRAADYLTIVHQAMNAKYQEIMLRQTVSQP